MSVGEGIFYGLVFLGVIYLYLQTKDRWNWKKIILWILGSTVGIVILILCIVFLSNFFSNNPFDKADRSSKPQVITSMNGISLGEKLSDVIFKTGAKKNKNDNEIYNFPNDSDKFFQIDSKTNTVKIIAFVCSQNAMTYPNLYSVDINEIRCGDSEMFIFQRYGKDKIRVLCDLKNTRGAEGDTWRLYDAVDYGVRYALSVNKVRAIYVYDPSDLKSDFGDGRWGSCP